jgi:PST family polysaccharide transporter
MQNLLLGIQQIKWFNLVDVGGRAMFFVACGTGALLFHRMDAGQIMGIALFSGLVTFLLAGARLLYLSGYLSPPDTSLLRKQAFYGFRAYLTCVSAYLVLKVDILMVRNIAGNAAAGYYSLASNMADSVYMFPAVVGMMLFPVLAGTVDPQQRWNRAMRTMAAVAAIMAVIAACAALLAKPLIAFAYGKQFLSSVPAFLVLCCAIVFYGANNVISIYFSSCGQPWCSVWVWPSAALLNIGLNLFCIRAWGIVGAAVASLLTYFALLAVQYGFAKKAFGTL